MKNLKNTTVEDVIADPELSDKLMKEYLNELKEFEKEENIDPYNRDYTCTEVISEMQEENTLLGLLFFSSFIKRVISLENGMDELEGYFYGVDNIIKIYYTYIVSCILIGFVAIVALYIMPYPL